MWRRVKGMCSDKNCLMGIRHISMSKDLHLVVNDQIGHSIGVCYYKPLSQLYQDSIYQVIKVLVGQTMTS